MRGSALVAGVVFGLGAFADPAAAQVREFDARGGDVDALRGVVVWVRQTKQGHVLMRRIGAITERVPGVRPTFAFRGPDLGLDRTGRVVAVYARCTDRCSGPYVADVHRGGERRLALPRRRGCRTSITAAVWRDRVAYGHQCRAGGSGVFLAEAGHTRRIRRLAYASALDPGLEIEGNLLTTARRIYSFAKRGCRRWAIPPQSRPGYVTNATDVQRDRVWFMREFEGGDGDGDSELMTAALHSDCRVELLGEPLRGFPMGPMLAYTLAVAGDEFYVTAEPGLWRGRF